jgi:3-hydroxybutyryl-CoA dehydrogenase
MSTKGLVGVVGAGTMGSGIAQTFAAAGFPVVLRDISGAALERGLKVICGSADRMVARGKLSTADRNAMLGRITTTTDLRSLARADLVVEAVIESLPVKTEVFGELDGLCSPETIFATNTSSISVTRIAAASKRPARVVGMHFFNPVPVMQLVEVVQALQTSDETCERIVALCAEIGKTARVSKDSFGFVVNRVLIPMVNEAINCVHEGLASPEDVDTMMKLGANHPMGPLSLADLIGLDIVLDIMETLYSGFDDPKFRPSPLLKLMCDAGYLGRKSGRGFFTYPPAG